MSQCSHLPSSGDDHDQQVYLHPFLPTYEASSPRPCAIFFSPCEEGSSEIDHRRSPTLEQEVKEEMEEIFFSGSESIGGENGQGECKWMSSKMRFMRKMSARPRKNGLGSNNHLKKFEECGLSSDNPSSPNGSVRVCSECNTTKTPLWRSGPCGPKSLCNACGIRQRKARRAMAAALSGGLIPAAAVAPPMKARKPKKSPGACAVPFKKRFKCFSSAENKHKIHCDEITIALGKNSTLPGVFPQDEKEAAILLMALSCGLIRR